MTKNDLELLRSISDGRKYWTSEGIIESIPHLVRAISYQGLTACDLLKLHNDDCIECSSPLKSCWHTHPLDDITDKRVKSIIEAVLNMGLTITIDHNGILHQVEIVIGWGQR